MNLFLDKMLNELLAEEIIVNNPTSCGDLFFNCLAEKEKVLQKLTIKSKDIITPQKPKNNSTDENKGNTEQEQNKQRQTTKLLRGIKGTPNYQHILILFTPQLFSYVN